MKKKTILFIMLIALILSYSTKNIFEVKTNNINYKENVEILEQMPGTYTSYDGKLLTVNSDGTILYENTYSLTVNKSSRGNVITGKIGTNNKAVTLYQVNETTIVSGSSVSYGSSSGTKTLLEYTTFKLTKTISPSENGEYELYRNNKKQNAYTTLQDAVDAATNGDTIKLTKNASITQGTYINKNITIEGNNKVLDKANWGNPVFIVEEEKNLNIYNLTIDGGEKTFEIDFSTTTPSIKANTLNNSVKSNTSILLSKGILTTDNFSINNHHTVQEGTSIRILRGKAYIKNGQFNHNYGNELAVVIRTGSTLKSSDTTYPVEEVIIDNCEFNNNYVPGGSGGAIIITNTNVTKVTNSKFYRNIVTTTSSGGGAIYYDATGQKTADNLNIDYPKLYIENSTFEENYSGNDGYAVSNDSAHLYINNSKFIGNVGIDQSTSVGTVSCMSVSKNEYDTFIENSLFQRNKGPVTGFGDHGTLVNLKIDNTTFDSNEGNLTVLIYQSNGVLSNLTFKNEVNQSGTIDIRTAYNANTKPQYQPNTVTLRDITFENTNTPAEIFIRKQNHNTSMNIVTVNLEGTIKGDIDVIDGQNLNIKGTVIGTIHAEDTVMKNNITEPAEDKRTYELKRYTNHYIATTKFPLDKENTQSIDYLYLEKGKTYTEKEIFMMLKNGVDGYTTKLYTNNTYTTPWSYTGNSNINLYGKLEEHTHEFDGTLIVDNNVIYEQCVLGHFGKKVSLEVLEQIKYNGKEIPVSVVNELNIKDYKITYYVFDNDKWNELKSIPKLAGKYKATLTYENLSIEKEYIIQEEIKNPNTSINTWLIFFATFILIISLVYIKGVENLKIKKYTNS